MNIRRDQFPPEFRWGAATSSYQIEGAADVDGRSPSIWDTFSRTPGKTRNGDTGEVACDHYHRYLEDAELMRGLGLNAYRFSVSWSRVLPDGVGRVNAKGLDFYSRLVDALLERGIEPWLTLYHWDLPQVLQDRGGWAARDTTAAFAEYAGVMAHGLGDRVTNWMTHNEPWCTAFLGHHTGTFAPGQTDAATAVQVSHHLLLSHGLAAQSLRAASSRAKVGAALNLWTIHPASSSAEDAAAARRYDGFCNRWYLDPLYGRGYPEDTLALYGDKAPRIENGDLETIATPTDFLGINYYIRMVIAHDERDAHLKARVTRADGERTDFDWEVYPDGMRECLERVQREYNPNYITENGACYDDTINPKGRIDDARRQRFLERHLKASLEARRNGAKLEGYFAWSLMDNFEWAEGYDRRFGLVHVDFATQTRTLKDSALWYADFLGARSGVAAD
jgi:beta-glucosidase